MLMVWAAKRAVMARIQSWADMQEGTGEPLDGVQIGYSLPPEPDRVCVYGGRARSSRTAPTAERNTLFREDITIDVRVRVVESGDDVESAERTAEGVAGQVSRAVSADPALVIGSVLVGAVDTDPTVVSPGPEPSVTVNVGLTVVLSMNTPGV
jgi:2,4-dienoyl-CoA reductase-like NADH-dependent reductase (Old Yellow Enzyme family)